MALGPEYVPAAHAVAAPAPLAQALPAGHGAQVADALAAWNCPLGQPAQLGCPLDELKVPAGQPVQLPSPAPLNSPASQTVAALAPAMQ